MAGSLAIDWVLLDHAAVRPVDIGDVVSVDAGGMPIYRVLAIQGREVWLGDERDAPIGALLLDRFRWRGEARA